MYMVVYWGECEEGHAPSPDTRGGGNSLAHCPGRWGKKQRIGATDMAPLEDLSTGAATSPPCTEEQAPRLRGITSKSVYRSHVVQAS